MVQSIDLIQKSIFLMHKIVNLFFIAASEFQNLLFFPVQILVDAINHSLFHIDDFIQPFSLSFECIGQVLYLLIFHQVFSCSLVLDFFCFGSMQSFDILDLFVLFVDRLVQLSLPLCLCAMKISAQLLEPLLSFLSVFLDFMFRLLKLIASVFILDIQFLFFVFQAAELVPTMLQLVLEFIDEIFQLCNSLLKDFLFRLGVFSFFLFLFQDSIDLGFKTSLNLFDPSFIFYLTFLQQSLIHLDLRIKRSFNSISFLLKLLKPVNKDRVHSFEFPDFAVPFLHFLEGCDLSIEKIVSELAWSVGKVNIGSFAILLRGEVVQPDWGLIALGSPALQQIVHGSNKYILLVKNQIRVCEEWKSLLLIFIGREVVKGDILVRKTKFIII